MTSIVIINPVFRTYVMANAPLKQLATGFDWLEGPVWFGDAGCLLFSDIPGNRIMRWSPETGTIVYRQPSNFANGNTRDRQGRLITCEHGARRVTRTEYDGSVTVIADSFQGRRLNSPNDVVAKSDGSIWFTDPHYGIMTDYEGTRSEQELPCQVYCVDPATGQVAAVLQDFACPNGLAFSPDETRLYVSDTGRMFKDDPTHIRVFDVDHNNHVHEGGILHSVSPGVADGMRVDSDGNLWTSAGDGVHCIHPSGELLGKIHLPETVSNVCFGGRNHHILFITASTGLYAIALNRRGVG